MLHLVSKIHNAACFQKNYWLVSKKIWKFMQNALELAHDMLIAASLYLNYHSTVLNCLNIL